MRVVGKISVAILVIGAICCTQTGWAKAKKKLRFPIGCFQAGYHFSYHVLTLQPTAKHHPQSLYFFHNLSHKSVKIIQMRSGNEPFIVHSIAVIKPKRWSALATDEKKSKYICAIKNKKEKHDLIVDCQQMLELCEFPHTRFGENHRGNYWVISNRGSHTALRNAVRYHGVLLVDPKKTANS